MKTICFLILLLVLTSTAARAQDEGYEAPPLTDFGTGIGGFRYGDRVRPTVPEGSLTSFYDPKSGKRIDGVVVRTIKLIEPKQEGIGDDVRTAQYEVLVPPASADGESMIYFVSPTGRAKGSATASEWIGGRNQQIADSLRHGLAANRRNAAALEGDEQRRKELSGRIDGFNDKYGTVDGLGRVTAEVAIAIAVDQIGKKLPKQYTGLSENESKVVNIIAGAHINGVADGVKKTVGGGTAGEVLAEGGVSTGIDVTLAPFLLDQVAKGKLADDDAAVLIALGKAVVKTAIEGKRLDDPSFQQIHRAFYDEVADVVPGAGVLAKDLDDLGLAAIDYYELIWRMHGTAGNQTVAANNQQLAISARRALENFAKYEPILRARKGVTYVPKSATAPIIGFVHGTSATTASGWNGTRGEPTVPTGAAPGATATTGTATRSAGTKR